jgi:hypothetical protein
MYIQCFWLQVLSIYSTPRPGFEILSEPEALYIHLLFGLKDKYIGMLEANFSSIILIAFRIYSASGSDRISKPGLGVEYILKTCFEFVGEEELGPMGRPPSDSLHRGVLSKELPFSQMESR